MTESTDALTREQVDALSGPVLLEFGAEWCGHCQALRPELTSLLAEHPNIHHYRIEDGRGKPLGRSFRVKLWPTLIFMRDGKMVSQLVRPPAEEVRKCLDLLDAPR